MFKVIRAAPADPILGLLDIFCVDDRPNKINLGIGVYKDETGNTPILPSVKEVEALLINKETSKNYLSIEGIKTFSSCTEKLLFGTNSQVINDARLRCAQTPGGTGALRVAADFLARNTVARRVWISRPSWPNHKNVFQAAGLEVFEYPYYDEKNHVLDFKGMFLSLSQVRTNDVVILHACCHNPTGIDPSLEQWHELSVLSFQNGWLPLFDFAYQGFSSGLDQDAAGLRIFNEINRELIVCSSYSKNFGLYNERVGACTLVAEDSDIVDRAFSQLRSIIRANYSNPPVHGAAIVASILGDDVLFTRWERELSDMRERIQGMRLLFVNTLKDKGVQRDFEFINQQKGMFSFSGLNKKQVLKLREEFGIYVLSSGRINVAGMTMENMAPLCEAIAKVL